MNHPVMMKADTVQKIDRERMRQTELWGVGQFQRMTPERVLAVLLKKVGEVAEALLRCTDPEEEIIHVAAVAARWLDECFSEDAC